MVGTERGAYAADLSHGFEECFTIKLFLIQKGRQLDPVGRLKL